MHVFRGQITPGPFGKLLEVCEQVGWNVSPPYIHDHDGVQLRLQTVLDSTMPRIAEDAWAQKIVRDTQKRTTFADLQGFDLPSFRTAQAKLSYVQKMILRPIRDGSFMNKQHHSKYDLSTSGKCAYCGGMDTPQHKYLECPATQPARDAFPAVVEMWPNLPVSLTHHLLPSRNAFWGPFKSQCLTLPEFSWRSVPVQSDAHLGLFTDGSCWENGSQYAIAAWAVVSVAARGTLTGTFQQNDVAELKAIQAAVSYAVASNRPTTIWSDSSYAAAGLDRLLTDPTDIPDDGASEVWKSRGR